MLQDVQPKMFSQNTRRSLAIIALYNISVVGIYATIFNLYLLRLGLGPARIGLVNSIYALASGVFSLTAGMLGNKSGARQMMLIGLAVNAAGIVLIPLSEVVPAQIAWLAIVAAVTGVGNTLFLVNLTPYMVSTTESELRTQAFAGRVVIDGFGAVSGTLVSGFLPVAFGRLLGSALSEPAPFRFSLLCAPLLLAAGVVAGSRTNDPTVPKAPGALSLGRSQLRVVLFLAIIWIAARIALGVIQSFFTVYLDRAYHLSPNLIGVVRGVGLATAVPTALAVPWLVRRMKREGVLVLAFLLLLASALLLSLSRSWVQAGISFAIYRIASSLLFAVFLLFSQEAVAPALRRFFSGTLYSVAGIGRFAAAIGGGYLIEYHSFQTAFLFAGGAALLALAVFLVYLRQASRDG